MRCCKVVRVFGCCIIHYVAVVVAFLCAPLGLAPYQFRIQEWSCHVPSFYQPQACRNVVCVDGRGSSLVSGMWRTLQCTQCALSCPAASIVSSTCIENQKGLANTHELFHVLVCLCIRLQDAAARLAPVRHQTQSTSNTRWVLPFSHKHFAESVSKTNHCTTLTKAPPASKRTRRTCLRFELGVASAPSGDLSGS